jgi:hypothetical protein
MYRCILLPTDGTEFCGCATHHGVELAKAFRKRLRRDSHPATWAQLDDDPEALVRTSCERGTRLCGVWRQLPKTDRAVACRGGASAIVKDSSGRITGVMSPTDLLRTVFASS